MRADRAAPGRRRRRAERLSCAVQQRSGRLRSAADRDREGVLSWINSRSETSWSSEAIFLWVARANAVWPRSSWQGGMSTPAVSERRQWLCQCVAYNTALVSSTAANAKQPPSASKPCALFHNLLYCSCARGWAHVLDSRLTQLTPPTLSTINPTPRHRVLCGLQSIIVATAGARGLASLIASQEWPPP